MKSFSAVYNTNVTTDLPLTKNNQSATMSHTLLTINKMQNTDMPIRVLIYSLHKKSGRFNNALSSNSLSDCSHNKTQGMA